MHHRNAVVNLVTLLRVGSDVANPNVERAHTGLELVLDGEGLGGGPWAHDRVLLVTTAG